MKEDKDLKIYAFENALQIIQSTVDKYDPSTIDEVFNLSEKIYNYLNVEDGK